jgi:hypothetical protein
MKKQILLAFILVAVFTQSSPKIIPNTQATGRMTKDIKRPIQFVTQEPVKPSITKDIKVQ